MVRDANWIAQAMKALYLNHFIQTMWSTPFSDKAEKGWRLKNGMQSIWFFNMRPLGDVPWLFLDIMEAMSDLIMVNGGVDVLVGVEMAGVPLCGSIVPIMSQRHKHLQRIGYTRPLEPKPLNPIEAIRIIDEFLRTGYAYGAKKIVEARFRDGDNVGIFDDMSTDLGSKIIARLQVTKEAGKQGVNVVCDQIFYFLNRFKDNSQTMKKIDDWRAHYPILVPDDFKVNYIVEFDDHFDCLEEVMHPEEFRFMREFQKNPEMFQVGEKIKKVRESVARVRQTR